MYVRQLLFSGVKMQDGTDPDVSSTSKWAIFLTALSVFLMLISIKNVAPALNGDLKHIVYMFCDVALITFTLTGAIRASLRAYIGPRLIRMSRRLNQIAETEAADK